MPLVCILAPPPPSAEELAKPKAAAERLETLTLHETVVAGCTYRYVILTSSSQSSPYPHLIFTSSS